MVCVVRKIMHDGAQGVTENAVRASQEVNKHTSNIVYVQYIVNQRTHDAFDNK